MSFILARKYGDRIRIFADKKMTVDPKDEAFLIKNIGVENYRRIKSLGVVKNVIINQNICVSSAGILEDFNDLLKYIDGNENILFDDICKKALEININSNNRTDFIICTVEDECRIIQIKDYEQSETDSSWIGSSKCFNKFQSIRFSDDMSKQTIYDCESKKEIPLDSEGIDSFSFSKVLKSNIDDTVGEESIDCASSNNRFYYIDKFSTSISKPRVLKQGQSLSLYDDVFDGGYTYYVYRSSDNYKLYIEQLKCGVEYCPHIKYVKYDHLRIPKFEYCDAADFEKNHNCGDYLITMNI